MTEKEEYMNISTILDFLNFYTILIVSSSFHCFFLFLYSLNLTGILFHTSVTLVYFSLKCVFTESTTLVCVNPSTNCTTYSV